MTVDRVSFTFDLATNDLQGDDDLTPYAVLDALGAWAHRNDVPLSSPDGPTSTEVLSLNGPGGGWPVVRLVGPLPTVLKAARAYAPDEDDDTLLDWILVSE